MQEIFQGDLLDYEIASVSLNCDHVLAIGKDTRDVYAWGNSEYGQAGFGAKVAQITTPSRLLLNIPGEDVNVVGVAAGGSFSLFLTRNKRNRVFALGYGILGAGVDQSEAMVNPVEVHFPMLGSDVPTHVFASADYAAMVNK